MYVQMPRLYPKHHGVEKVCRVRNAGRKFSWPVLHLGVLINLAGCLQFLLALSFDAFDRGEGLIWMASTYIQQQVIQAVGEDLSYRVSPWSRHGEFRR